MHNVTLVIFNLFMDGVVKKMEAKVGNVGVEMSIDNEKIEVQYYDVCR